MDMTFQFLLLTGLSRTSVQYDTGGRDGTKGLCCLEDVSPLI